METGNIKQQENKMKTAEPTVMEKQSALEMLAKNNEGVKGNKKQVLTVMEGQHIIRMTEQEVAANLKTTKEIIGIVKGMMQDNMHTTGGAPGTVTAEAVDIDRVEVNQNQEIWMVRKTEKLHMEFTRVMEQPKPMDMDKPLCLEDCLMSQIVENTTHNDRATVIGTLEKVIQTHPEDTTIREIDITIKATITIVHETVAKKMMESTEIRSTADLPQDPTKRRRIAKNDTEKISRGKRTDANPKDQEQRA